jgi:hypothetical protein
MHEIKNDLDQSSKTVCSCYVRPRRGWWTVAGHLTLLWVAVLFVGMLNVGTAGAQATQQFTGHVLDSTGALVPLADVVVHNQGTGVDVKTATTPSGVYTVTYLDPGTYTVTVSKKGFKIERKTDVVLDVDQTSTLDFALSPGSASETITVRADEAAQVELSKSDRGEIIDGKRIEALPLDGRNPLDLFSLSPGTHDFSSSQYPRPFDAVTDNQYANGSPQQGQESAFRTIVLVSHSTNGRGARDPADWRHSRIATRVVRAHLRRDLPRWICNRGSQDANSTGLWKPFFRSLG